MASAKSNCLIHTISSVIICLLLLVFIYVSYYIYYSKYRPKKEHLLSFHESFKKLKGIDINNIILEWIINLKK